MAQSSIPPRMLFLDVNILMELFFERTKRGQVASTVLSYDDTRLATSMIAISTFFYFVEKHKYDKNLAHDFIANYVLLSVDLPDYSWAKDNDQGDFEDALQVACALRHGCKIFMTLDIDLAKQYKKHISTKLIS